MYVTVLSTKVLTTKVKVYKNELIFNTIFIIRIIFLN